MNPVLLDSEVENAVRASRKSIERFRNALGPFALYHGKALEIAYSPDLVSRIVKQSRGSIRILWTRIPQAAYIEAVREFLDTIQERHGWSDEELARNGFSIRAAKAYFDYLRGETVVGAGLDVCNFALGCPLNDPDRGVEAGMIHRDHLLPAAYGGSETQAMCGYHNRVKQDFPLYDVQTLDRMFRPGDS